VMRVRGGSHSRHSATFVVRVTQAASRNFLNIAETFGVCEGGLQVEP
jgi:hypothetical protein